MTVGILHALVVGAALFALGVFAFAYRPAPGTVLRGLPILAAGAAVALAGASRLASAAADPIAGQELAVLGALGALGLAGLGAAILGRFAS